MSETTIEAYSIVTSEIEKNLGSGSEELIQRIIEEQKNELEDCRKRFEYAEGETITPEDAVKAVISGAVPDENVYECTCVVVPILAVIGSRLEDDTPAGSLNFNTDYWNDDFENVFRELGLSTLADIWEKSSFPITKSGETCEWPILTLLDKFTLEKCKSEFEAVKFEETFDKLPEELFTQKSEDSNSFIMRCNIECLQKWISQCIVEEKCLFIIFDGDT